MKELMDKIFELQRKLAQEYPNCYMTSYIVHHEDGSTGISAMFRKDESQVMFNYKRWEESEEKL